jgi:hypothetical protein
MMKVGESMYLPRSQVVFSLKSAVLLVRPQLYAEREVNLRFRLAGTSLVEENDPVDFGIKVDGI